MAERILLIEDDPSIQKGLELNLSLEGFEVRIACTGPDGVKQANEWRPDLILLDLMLPGQDGYEVCRSIRRLNIQAPILIVSARGAEAEKVKGLELGADDFITKPFGLQELLARVRAQLRRAKGANGTSNICFGDVEVDLSAGEVRRGGLLVELTAKELKLLEFFLKREGRVVTRQMILDAVWGEEYFGTDRTVDNFITRLRQKLDSSEDPRYFQTVRGLGYRFRNEPR
jgi:DNA-binding response OmpR family regulator